MATFAKITIFTKHVNETQYGKKKKNDQQFILCISQKFPNQKYKFFRFY